jgi:hypothetical protein
MMKKAEPPPPAPPRRPAAASPPAARAASPSGQGRWVNGRRPLPRRLVAVTATGFRTSGGSLTTGRTDERPPATTTTPQQPALAAVGLSK